jgi:hypothetical protein
MSAFATMLAGSLLMVGGLAIESALESIGTVAGVTNSDHVVASVLAVLSPFLTPSPLEAYC